MLPAFDLTLTVDLPAYIVPDYGKAATVDLVAIGPNGAVYVESLPTGRPLEFRREPGFLPTHRISGIYVY